MKRRAFLRTAGLAGIALTGGLQACGNPSGAEGATTPRPYRVGGKARMRLSFEPYELQLRHTFTVAS